MRVKIAKCFAVVALAASMCLAPFAQAAYANTAALTAGGTALASVLAVYGINVANSDGTLDPAKLWTTWTGFLDDVTSDMVDEARSAAIASNPDYFNNVLAWDQGGREKIEADFIDWGQTGTIPLDALSISQSGALGLIPFLLSLFMADQVVSGADLPMSDGMFWELADGTRYYAVPSDNPFGYFTKPVNLSAEVSSAVAGKTLLFVSYYPSSAYFNSGVTGGSAVYCDSYIFETAKKINLVGGLVVSPNSSNFSNWCNMRVTQSISLAPDSNAVFWPDGTRHSSYRYFDNGPVYFLSNLALGGDFVITRPNVTDNPDVNLGHDYWDDAKANKDILNPAAGASVVGSDLVIDGDYIANRGSLGVITDWADINSWADALARAHAGVIDGALDGTISGTATGTAVNVGTGELVTDTVGELVKPDAGTSVSPSKDFDWGKFLDPSLYLVFPFCLPWDLVELVKTLSAEPQAPVIDLPMPTLTGQQNLHVDLSPWSPVAAVLRAGELIVAAVGLIWITKTMIRN